MSMASSVVSLQVCPTRCLCCRMHAYVHWDVDLFMDNATTNRTIDLIKRYEGTAIRGVFQLASDPLGNETVSPTFVGSIPVFKPIYQYGPANATAAAAAINNVQPGSAGPIGSLGSLDSQLGVTVVWRSVCVG